MFFLPSVKACNGIESPLRLTFDDFPKLAWVGSPFVAALLLLCATLALWLRKRSPGRGAWIVATLATATVFIAELWSMIAMADRRDESSLTLQDVLVPEEAGAKAQVAWRLCAWLFAGFLVRRAVRSAGWSRWVTMLGIYTVLASVFCLYVIQSVLSDGPVNGVGVGGWLYLLAIPALGALAISGKWVPGRGLADHLDGAP